MSRAIVWLVAVAACGAEEGPRVDGAAPPWAPLTGGTVVRVTGANLPADTRVLIGGREAAAVIAIDDGTLDVIVPPGERSGDVELIALTGAGNAIAPGLFRYSAPPAIADISPREVVSAPDGGGTLVITGTGFLDEDAGAPTVLLDGFPVEGAQILSDTEVRVAIPSLRPLHEPTVTLVNRRGATSRERAYRYRPSAHGGLILFTRGSPTFATFVDPVRGHTVAIPRATAIDQLALTAVVVDERGDYWGIERNNPMGTQFGRIDMRTHTMEQAVLVGERLPGLVRVGTVYYGIARDTLTVGRLNTQNGDFNPEIALSCCGNFGISYHEGKLWFTRSLDFQTPVLQSFDLATGVLSDPLPVKVPGGVRFEDLRHFQGVLYAISREGSLRSIDTSTGDTTLIASDLFQVHAMEILE